MTTTGTRSRLVSHWLDGRADAGDSERRGPIWDPARGEIVAEVAYASAADVDRAVASAQAALPGWRATPVARRCEVLFRFRELLIAAADELARVISNEHGKTIADARGEVQRGLEIVELACAAPKLLAGAFSHEVARGIDTYTMREPLGVVAGITPFNFPAMVPLWMAPIALACGNAFVLKPSEKDPSASCLLAGLLAEAGLPPGVFSVVHGDRIAVERLLEHPHLQAISFVGSTPVARAIYETAARHGKRVQALGGAKNHMVVLPDADLDAAADAAVAAGYGSAGERCMAISVVVAVGPAGEALVPRIAERIDRLRVGPGDDPSSEMGPLITREHRDRVATLIERGATEGAELVRDGRTVAVPGCERGFFLGPTLFDRVTPEMTIYREEIFGPVLCVVRAASLDEAIALVNANRWANGTAVFTRDGGAARHFEDAIEVGMVGINVPIPVPVGTHAFGGWRESLFGDLGVYGEDGFRFYTRPKVVTRRWSEPSSASQVNLSFPSH